jgi:hypothetical protein
VLESQPSFESLPESGPVRGLAAELYGLLYPADGLEVVVTRTGDGIRIETTPAIDAQRLLQTRAIAEKHLADSPNGARVSLRIDGASVVISSTVSTVTTTRKEPELSYIPLEPEPAREDTD